jgi:nicotinate-nucleotide pyrophosphorylase (carboxylating)
MSDKTNYGLTPVEFIKLALAEDTGNGDHTSLSTIDKDKKGNARVMVKDKGIVAGLEVAHIILQCVDESLIIHMKALDGDRVENGDELMIIEGNVRSLLKAERLLLNCLQRMSGIATMTREFVDALKGTETKILDTRKTTPNFRYFEKLAVRIGGGFNHRFGLYDMILIKDNHVDAAGGIQNALKRAKEYLAHTGKNLQIEIETRNISEVEEVLKTGIANRIMLDNFGTAVLTEAVKLIDKKFETEASGGITLSNARSYALSGVDYLSVGALTHSYKSMDISMKIIN